MATKNKKTEKLNARSALAQAIKRRERGMKPYLTFRGKVSAYFRANPKEGLKLAKERGHDETSPVVKELTKLAQKAA